MCRDERLVKRIALWTRLEMTYCKGIMRTRGRKNKEKARKKGIKRVRCTCTIRSWSDKINCGTSSSTEQYTPGSTSWARDEVEEPGATDGENEYVSGDMEGTDVPNPEGRMGKAEEEGARSTPEECKAS
jgi:hypothetical protein